MLISLYRKPIPIYVTVYYKPSDKSYYHEIDYVSPRREIGDSNRYGHTVVAIVNLSDIFFKRKYIHIRKIYVKLYHFLEKRLDKLDRKEMDYQRRFIDHT